MIGGILFGAGALGLLIALIAGICSENDKLHRASYIKPSVMLEYEPGGCSSGGNCEPVTPSTIRAREEYNRQTAAQRWSRYAERQETQTGRRTNETARTDEPIPARSWPVKIEPIPNGIPLPDEAERVNVPLCRR